MRKWTLGVLAGVAAMGGFALWYLTGPRRVAEGWFACGADHKNLVSEADAKAKELLAGIYGRGPFEIAEKACLDSVRIEKVQISGFSATASWTKTYPDLSFDEHVEFPPGSSEKEKIGLLRERAKAATLATSTGELNLKFSAGGWKVVTTWQAQAFAGAGSKAADKLKELGDYDGAIAAYDELAGQPELEEYQQIRDHLLERRLKLVGEKACLQLTKRQLRYPAAAEFREFFTTGASKSLEISVFGKVLTANGFGVKTESSVYCTVAKSASGDKTAEIKLSLTSSNPLDRMVEASETIPW